MAKSISKSYGSSLKVIQNPTALTTFLAYSLPLGLHHLLPRWLKQSAKHSSCFSLPTPHLCLQSIPNAATRWFLLSQSRSFLYSKPISQKSKSQIPYNAQIDPYELTSPLFFWFIFISLSLTLCSSHNGLFTVFSKCEVLCTFVDHIGYSLCLWPSSPTWLVPSPSSSFCWSVGFSRSDTWGLPWPS